MSHYSSSICSDEELLKELRKLGYDEVPSDILDSMKGDLVELLEKEKPRSPALKHISYSDPSDHLPILDHKSTTRLPRKTKKKSRSGTVSPVKVCKDKPLKSKKILCDDIVNTPSVKDVTSDSQKQVKAKIGKSSQSPEDSSFNCVEEPNFHSNNSSCNSRIDFDRNAGVKLKTCSPSVSKENCYRSDNSSSSNRLKQTTLSKQRSKTSSDISSPVVADSQDMHISPPSLQSSILNNSDKCSDFNLNPSSVSSGKRTIKRKVLRRRNGQSIITEEMVEAPVFDTSYPESESFNNSKSFSSDDLSSKSNNSTGSVSVVNSESSLKSSPSTHSLKSTRSSSLRLPNSRKKKSDPVTMYSYYKKFWDNFKPPGEKTHDKLRWAVRDRMLEYDL